MSGTTIPRRIQRDKQTPAERIIGDAMLAVEQIPHADVLLTDAVVLLQQAREKVSEFIDRDFPDASTYEHEESGPEWEAVEQTCRIIGAVLDGDPGPYHFGSEKLMALVERIVALRSEIAAARHDAEFWHTDASRESSGS